MRIASAMLRLSQAGPVFPNRSKSPMYTRLWWKDARQFWPIWLFLALAAAFVQGLILYYVGHDARQGVLGISALICASLYAFATGAAAFAGEREMGTLRLLDILPADRRVVWAAKVSFALVTTLALTLILLAMAAVYTDRWKPEGSLSVWEALSFAMIVVVALGWGLFWSAILSNALIAALAAIFCTAVSLSVLLTRLDSAFLFPFDLSGFVLCQLSLFLVTVIASVAIFAPFGRWKRIRIEFRSPVVINLADSTSPRCIQLQVQSPVATMRRPPPAAGIAGILPTNEPPRHSWLAEVRALAWQTMKEGRKTWCLLAAIWLVPSVLLVLLWRYLPSPDGLQMIGIGAGLVAGASVFGLENRARTQRFLTYHGARPGTVWLVKLAVWGVALCAVSAVGLTVNWGRLAFMEIMTLERSPAVSIENWLAGISMVLLYFGVALLCGMAIRRGITAIVIALVVSLALTIPLVTLLTVNMLPALGLLVIPAALLLVSWAWSGDWLLDRPAPGRWIRLGLLLAAMFSLTIGWYAGHRAWSIPDVGPIAPPAVWSELATARIPADQNAAELYREAGHRLVGPVKDSAEFLDRNRGLLAILHRAAARSNCRFLEPERLTVLDVPDVPPVNQLAYLLTCDASERQNHGDLAGAWDDIMSVFRMAHHVGAGSGFARAFPDVVSLERDALGHALEWAVARGQTPEQLRKALVAYRELPKICSTTDMIRAEANIVEKTFDLPASRLYDWTFELANGSNRPQGSFGSALFDLATMPWEVIRARRVNRLIANALLQDAAREPWQRSRVPDSKVAHARMTSRNAMMLIRNLEGYVAAFDQNEVARRALIQVMALRAWQLQHGGQFPKSLDALVPTELPSLPDDPYSGHEFRYVPSHGLDIPALRIALTPSVGKGHVPTPGSWLLYSIGPNGHDDGGITFRKNASLTQLQDIVFEIPPVASDDGASKKHDGTQDPVKDRSTPTTEATAPPKPSS